MKVCAEPGCPSLTNDTRCDQHRKARRKQQDKRRPTSRQRGYDSKWRKVRANYLRFHPTCQDPTGCIEPASDVHHLDGMGPMGPRGHDWSNMMGLCHPHHSQVTATEQKSGWNA